MFLTLFVGRVAAKQFTHKLFFPKDLSFEILPFLLSLPPFPTLFSKPAHLGWVGWENFEICKSLDCFELHLQQLSMNEFTYALHSNDLITSACFYSCKNTLNCSKNYSLSPRGMMLKNCLIYEL